jgi:heat shock protein HslJ
MLGGFWRISVVLSDARLWSRARQGLGTEFSTSSLPSLPSSLNESLIESWPQESPKGDSFLLLVDRTLLAEAGKDTHFQGAPCNNFFGSGLTEDRAIICIAIVAVFCPSSNTIGR